MYSNMTNIFILKPKKGQYYFVSLRLEIYWFISGNEAGKERKNNSVSKMMPAWPQEDIKLFITND